MVGNGSSYLVCSPWRPCASAALVLVCSGIANPQSVGKWEPAFQHGYNTPDGPAAMAPAALPPGASWAENAAAPTLPQFNAAHLTVIPRGPDRGKILAWEGNASYQLHVAGYHRWAVVDPGVGEAAMDGVRFRNHWLQLRARDTGAPIPDNIFCAGLAWDAYGHLFVGGGQLGPHPCPQVPGDKPTEAGSTVVLQFAPELVDSSPWMGGAVGLWLGPPALLANQFLARPRWYATVVFVPDAVKGTNRMLVVGGMHKDYAAGCPNGPFMMQYWNDYESYDVGIDATGAPTASHNTFPGNPRPYLYDGPPAPASLGGIPRLHLLSSGAVCLSGFSLSSAQVVHDPRVQVAWSTSVGALPSDLSWSAGMIRQYDSSVLFPNLGGVVNDIVLRTGGFAVAATFPFYGVAGTEALWANGPPRTPWVVGGTPGAIALMANARGFMNFVILPNGQLLALGGVRTNDGAATDVFVPELFDPRTNVWYPMSPSSNEPRRYHSAAALLPDGRVFVGGGEGRNHDYQVFQPPYLTLGLARPQNVRLEWPLAGGEHLMRYRPAGGEYRIRCDPLPGRIRIAKAVLMRPCCSTHHSDMDQRYVELETVRDGSRYPASEIVVLPPRDKLQAPPGFYMLFLVTDQGPGAPSVARWVWLTE